MKTQPPRTALPVALTVALATMGLQSCGDREELHELAQLRVPLVQFFLEADAASVAKNKTVGCEKFDDGKTYCQQYPLYVGLMPRNYKVRLVAISPEGQAAKNMRLTKVSSYTLGRVGATTLTSFDKAEDVTAQFPSATKAPVRKVLSSKALRVEQALFDFTLPGAASYLAKKTFAPVYSIDYEVTSATGGRADVGFVPFFAYPDPNDADLWKLIDAEAAKAGVDAAALAAIKQRAKRNTPPVIASLAPKNGSKAANVKFDLNVSVAATDTDPGAKLRLQWFTTRGKLGNQRARKTSWEPEGTGPAGVFVVARDLQGGLAFNYSVINVE